MVQTTTVTKYSEILIFFHNYTQSFFQEGYFKLLYNPRSSINDVKNFWIFFDTFTLNVTFLVLTLYYYCRHKDLDTKAVTSFMNNP